MRTISITIVVLALMASACSGFTVVQKRQPDHPVVVHESKPVHPVHPVHPAHIGIPPGHLPPPGQCRVWIPGRPPGHQRSPGNCSVLENEVPPGAWLVYRPSDDRKHIEVSVYDVERPQLIVAVGVYEVSSGRLVTDARATRPR